MIGKTLRLEGLSRAIERIDAKIILLLCSCSMYMVAYSFVSCFCWSISIAYGLIYCYHMHARKLSKKQLFLDAIMWGMSIYAFQLYPLYMLSFTHASNLGLLFLMLVCCYIAFVTAIWFLLTNKMLHSYHTSWYSFLVMTLSIYSYIYFIDRYSFFIFGICEGYGALHPLVPLMQVSICRKLVWLIGAQWGTLFFVLFCNGIALAFCSANKKISAFIVALIIVLAALDAQLYYAVTIKKPDWISKIGVLALPLQVHCAGKQWDIVQEIYKKICHAVLINPQVELIILPESSCCFELNRFPEMIRFLSQNLRNGNGDSIAIILGSHRIEKRGLYNTLYYLQDNALYTYDKTHGLIGAERLPWCITWFYGNKSLLVNGSTFAQGALEQDLLVWQNKIFKPYICSELFFSSDEPSENILCIANDAWYSGTFLPKILFLTAVYKAISAGKKMLYVAHEYAYYVDGESCIDLKKG